MKKFTILTLLSFFFLKLFCQVEIEEIGIIPETIEKASEFFKSYKYEKSIELLTPLINSLENKLATGSLQDSDEFYLKKIYELRGISLYLTGKENLSKNDFEKLIKLDPNYQLEATTSTKINKLFNSIRSSICGILTLKTVPEEAKVFIDSKFYEKKEGIYLLEGLHRIKIEANGYDSFEKVIEITANREMIETVKLKPNSRKIYFFLNPYGTKLFVDGTLAGIANIKATNKNEWIDYIQNSGFDPDEFFVIESLYIPLGKHTIEVSAPCYKKKSFTLPVTLESDEQKAGFIKPIKLEKETLEFKITSKPSDATIEIDGEIVGKTPLTLENFCSGEHSIKIYKEGIGEFFKRISFSNMNKYELNARLRPSILFLGFTYSMDMMTKKVLAELKKSLEDSNTFNIKFSMEENPLLPDLFFARGVPENEIQKTIEDLTKKYKCEGILIGNIDEDNDNKLFSLRLFIINCKGYDEIKDYITSNSDIHNILKRFDSPPLKEEPFSFFTDEKNRIYILNPRYYKNVLKPKDQILKINDLPIESINDFDKFLKTETIKTIEISRGPNILRFELPELLQIKLFPSVPGCNRRELLLNKISLLTSEDERENVISKINYSISLIELNQFEEALKELENIKIDDNTKDLSPTIDYLMAICYFKTQRNDETKRILLSLLSREEAIYWGNDNTILLKPLVSELLKEVEN